MDKKTSSAPSIWRVNLTPAVIGLIPAAVGINYVAKAFAEGLKLPVWLGSLGTYLASMLAGPIPGAISGFINNVIYGLTLSPVSTVYALTSIGIGIAWGDSLFAVLVANHVPVFVASFVDEFVLDILDKVVVAYVACLIYKQIPKKMISYFKD